MLHLLRPTQSWTPIVHEPSGDALYLHVRRLIAESGHGTAYQPPGVELWFDEQDIKSRNWRFLVGDRGKARLQEIERWMDRGDR